MPQVQEITYLSVPVRKARPLKSIAPTLNVGQPYFIHSDNKNPVKAYDGIISDYQFSIDASELRTFSVDGKAPQRGIIWDADSLLAQENHSFSDTQSGPHYSLNHSQLKSNHLQLRQASLSEPDITLSDKGSVLTLSPQFEFEFVTQAFSAQLGFIHLVQAQRFVVLENGEQVMLFDSGDDESVLYLPHLEQESPFSWQSPVQAHDVRQNYLVSTEAAQLIPENLSGQRVVNLTVLEKYTSFLMQRYIDPKDNNIVWIPIHSPIQWGWSIRVGCRSDGDWAIMRRKVMLPNSSDTGLEFPLWQANNFSPSRKRIVGL